MTYAKHIAAAALALVLVSGCAKPLVDPYAAGFGCDRLGVISEKGKPPVGIYQERDGVISFVSDMDILYDGSPRAYNADDPGFLKKRPNSDVLGGPYSSCTIGPSRECALESVCSGIKLVIPQPIGDPKVLTGCKTLLDNFIWFRDHGWPHKKPDGSFLDYYAFGMRVSGGGRRIPCLRNNRWIVSKNALRRESGQKKDECDVNNWVDANIFNGIVASPKLLELGSPQGRRGDLAVVRYRGRLVGALITDTNEKKTGEASAALAAQLLQKPFPKNLSDGYSLAIDADDVEYFIFPGTYGSIKHLVTDKKADAERIAQIAVNLAQRYKITSSGSRRACKYTRIVPYNYVAPTAPQADVPGAYPDNGPTADDEFTYERVETDPYETDRKNSERYNN